MAQERFVYDTGTGQPGSQAAMVNGAETRGTSLSIFANRPGLRAQLRDDATAAGLHIVMETDLGALLADTSDGTGNNTGLPALSELVLVDCPIVDAVAMAALSRLDLRAAQCGTRMIVSTTVAGIDDVFACMDLSAPQLLVDPSLADRVIALGEALARMSPARVQELSEEDRLAMLRLTEQVGQIARRLDDLRFDGPQVNGSRSARAATGEPQRAEVAPTGDNLFRFDPAPWREPDAVRATQPGWNGPERVPVPLRDMGRDMGRGTLRGPASRMTPPDTLPNELPNPRLIRQIIRERQLRGRFLDPELFADPAWDMLLDLTAAAAEHVRVSVSSLCIAAAVPPTTALRWIRQMTDGGLLARIDDDQDKRRAFITLTDRARAAMASYFQELGKPLAALA